MDLERARAFMREHHRAVMMTHRSDGSPQLSPVLVGIDAQGRAIVSSREAAMKTLNVRRDPRVALCVMNDGFFGAWIRADGIATVVSLPEAMEPLVDYYRIVAGEHPQWSDYRAAMEREQRALLRVELTRAGPDREG